MRLPFLAPTLLTAVACLAGCATSVLGSGDTADADVATTATAIVVVERTVTASAASDTARGEAVARVVRMRSGAVDDEALRLVGGAIDLPALGACGAVGVVGAARETPASAAGATASPLRAMSLVDVGAVTLEAGGVRTSLAARQLPDVADLVSGVVYTARPGDGAIPARGRFVLRAAGSADLDVAPFFVDATAPGEPADLRIAAQDARAASGVALVAGAAAELTWTPGSGDDVVYVDIVPSLPSSSAPSLSAAGSGSALGAASPATVRCLFADATGRGTLPASALGALEEGTLSVHRLHREAFRARGVDPGEVRFDFARAVAFNRR